MFVTKELFDEMMGILIKKCQCIEHDIKIMYAGMLRGDFSNNLDTVINKPLGSVLEKLEELDYSDESPYLSREDYTLLNEIKEIRNYWVHKGYIDFYMEQLIAIKEILINSTESCLMMLID